jgi:integrase
VDWHPTRGTRRVRRVVGTKQEAEAVLAALVVEHRVARYPVLQPPTVTPTSPLTFADLAARFLAEHPGSRRSNHYPKVLARLLPHLSTLPIRSIDRAILDRLRVRLLTDPAPTLGRPLSTGSVVITFRVLHRVLKMAVRWRLLEVNPAIEMDLPSPGKARTRFLTLAEYGVLEGTAPEWLLPVLRLAVSTGLRLKGATLIRLEDIDEASGLLHVPQDTKTGYRVVPLGATAATALRAIHSGPPLAGELNQRRISEATRRAARRAGIKGASFHTLRHTAASWMVQAGVPLLAVQRILGHSSPAMTAIYSHLAPDHLRPAIATLDHALLRGKPVDKEDLERRAESRILPKRANPRRGTERPPTRAGNGVDDWRESPGLRVLRRHGRGPP